jgi:hypothetical protein
MEQHSVFMKEKGTSNCEGKINKPKRRKFEVNCLFDL